VHIDHSTTASPPKPTTTHGTARPVIGSGMGSRGQLGGQFAGRPSCAIRARLVRFYRFRADRQVRQPTQGVDLRLAEGVGVPVRGESDRAAPGKRPAHAEGDAAPPARALMKVWRGACQSAY